jgi:uncharacterized protein YhfF
MLAVSAIDVLILIAFPYSGNDVMGIFFINYIYGARIIKIQGIILRVIGMVDESVIKMWNEFQKLTGGSAATYTAWQFGRTPEVGDELAALVLEGRKRATTGLAFEYEREGEPLPKKGDLSIVLGGDGKARCIIRTTSVRVMPFKDVPEEFAWKEGEDDRSLKSWREVHERVFTLDCQDVGKRFSPDMPVVCEEFEVVFQ